MKLEQLYEDKVTGTITADTFTKLAEKAEAERTDISDMVKLLEQSTTEAKTKVDDIQKWIRIIKKTPLLTMWTELYSKLLLNG